MAVLIVSLLLVASTASGQSLIVQGAAGPTIIDAGYSVAAHIGFTPISRLTVLFGVDRTHLSSRVTTDGLGRVTSTFRGGTVTLATAEARVTFRRRDRVSPYVLGGFGAGVSRPTVNEIFPDPVTNHARVLFLGGGVHVPLREPISLFGDVRMVFGVEGNDGIVAVAPVRAGLAWRF